MKKPLLSLTGVLKWWAHLDSNQGPKDYESSALANDITCNLLTTEPNSKAKVKKW